jgi:hypothetical protein
VVSGNRLGFCWAKPAATDKEIKSAVNLLNI